MTFVPLVAGVAVLLFVLWFQRWIRQQRTRAVAVVAAANARAVPGCVTASH